MLVSSIDLMGGKAVQLRNGKEKVLEKSDPVALAEEFAKLSPVAVIDLDAAMGNGENEQLIRKICTLADCRVGGGIRSIAKAKKIFSYGAQKLIIGTTAFEADQINHSFLQELVDNFGKERIMIAIDAYQGKITTQGWKHDTGLDVYATIQELENYCDSFLFTMVETEGCMTGMDMDAIKRLQTKNQLTVAGGIKDDDQIIALSKMGYDVQVGMALYTGAIDLHKCFVESLAWDKADLLPTITQDPFGNVLMLAYSNKESLYKTLREGKVTYYSRSRKALWTKGETSGNRQSFICIRPDCDRDTLLIRAHQKGVACHLGNYSCFGDKPFDLNLLYDIVRDRFANPSPKSYTAKLAQGDLLKEKIMEEAEEVCDARSLDDKIWEVGDLLYFLTCYLAKEGISFAQVFNELQRRDRK